MELDWPEFARGLVASLVYATIGLTFFSLALVVFRTVASLPLREELIHKRNVALAIVVAAVILGLSNIIASAIGP